MSVLVPTRTAMLPAMMPADEASRWRAIRAQGAELQRLGRAAGASWAARDTSVAWMTFMGIPQEGVGIDVYDKLSDFGRAPADVGWVMACIGRIFNAAASVPLRVWVKAGQELVPWEDQPTPAAADYQALLDTVNPIEDMSGAVLRGYLAASRKAWGGWYLKVVSGRLLHDPQELYFMPASDVKPHSRDGRVVDYYEYRPGTYNSIGNATSMTYEVIDPQEMIRFRGLNLRSQVEMVSPLSAARYDMVSDQAASMRTASILRRRGVPEGYWSARQGVELNRQDKSAIRRWLRQLTGPQNAGRALVAPDIEFKAIDLPEKDAQWLNGRGVSRMMISAILGVPLALAGDVEHAGFYRAPIDAQRVFWRDTVVPEMNTDADVLNARLSPSFNRPGDPVLVVAHDFSGVFALKPDNEWSDWLQAMDHMAVVPDEFRAHFRIGGPVPWGRRPVPKTQITFRPQDMGTGAPLAFLDPDAVISEDPVQEIAQAGGGDEVDLPASLRAVGRLYAHPAVRAFIAGGPLDAAAIVGHEIGAAERATLEDGIRRRQSAAQIAERLTAVRKGDVTDAVVGQLRAQWPERELRVVRKGKWSFDPGMKLKKIDYARRPVKRNPQKVDDFEAAIDVGADQRPAAVIDTSPIGGSWVPVDGWHHLLAADHAGLKKYPVYRGTGSADWVRSMLAFNDQIPTPKTEGPG